MNESRWSASHVLHGTAVIIGAFLLWWGVMSITTPGYYDEITIAWFDQALRFVNRLVWVPLLGVMFLGVGLAPVINAGVRNYRVVRIAVGGVGVLFVGFGGYFASNTLNRIFGLIFVSPIILAGISLIAVALVARASTEDGNPIGMKQ